jgi:hypothetical protein
MSPQWLAQICNPCPQKKKKMGGINKKVKEFYKGHGLQIHSIRF